jgi:hypothetical protein
MRRSRYVTSIVLPALLISACGMSAAPSPGNRRGGTAGSGTHPLVITERDSGKTFTISPKTRVSLRLSSREHWTPPRVRGTAIELVTVAYFRDPGFSEWTIRILGIGAATLTSSGELNCGTGSLCTGSRRRFAVKIVVAEATSAAQLN